MSEPQYIARDLRPDDVNRVCKDWLGSYRREMKGVPNQTYYYQHGKAIQTLLADPTVAWLVLCPADKPSLILGWCCGQVFDNGVWLVHNVYVSRSYRRLGFASRLLATMGVPKGVGLVASHMTGMGRMLCRGRGNEATWNPYLFMGRLHVPVQVGKKWKALKDAGVKAEEAVADAVQMQAENLDSEIP